MDWSAFGGWSQEYRYDSTSVDTSVVSTDFTSQSMVITDGDFSLRGRGERFDVQTRVNAGFLYDLLPDGSGNQTRVSIAYGDLADRTVRPQRAARQAVEAPAAAYSAHSTASCWAGRQSRLCG